MCADKNSAGKVIFLYENIVEISKKFNINPINVYKCRYYYVLNCSSGAYSLSVARPKPSKINEIHRVKECLFDYGIHNIDTYSVTSDNLPYYEEDGKVYVVTRYFGANELDFNSNTQVSVALNDIGRLHKGLRLMSEEMLSAASDNNTTISMYRSKAKSLERIIKLINQKGSQYWDKEKIKTFRQIAEECLEITQKLDELDYGKNATYCHCGLKEGNIIYKKGRTYIIDWDNMKYLNYIEDIAFFIRRYVRKNCYYSSKNNLQYMSLDEVLNKYSRYTSISDYDYDVLRVVLMYPHRFVSAMEDFFKRSKSFLPTGVKNKLDEIVEQREFMREYLS